MGEETFDQFVAGNEDYICFVQNLLQAELPAEPGLVEKAGSEAESHYGRMTTIEAYAKSFVAMETFRKLPARGEGKTDIDRRLEVESSVAPVERFHGIVKGLVKALEIRVNYCQSLLKAYSVEGRRTRTMA